MDTATFLAEFEHLADAPDGVKKLREMILQLAVRGKLVPQDRNDEPASVLLEKIAAEKERLIKEKKIKKQKPLPPVDPDDVPYELPEGWEWTRFGGVTVNRDGERIPLSREVRSTRHGPYDYYGASGVIDHIDDYLFDKPLLLIGEDGANLINRATPIAFIATGKYWVNNHAHVLDGFCIELLRYFELFIEATDLRPYITGTAQPKMNQAKMNTIPVALPPLAEQKRIINKVDQLMALCDQLEKEQEEARTVREQLGAAAHTRLTDAPDMAETSMHWNFVRENFHALESCPENIAHLRKTILQLAVMGRLVPQDPNDEPASVLLEKIAAEKERLIKEGKIKKQKPLTPVDPGEVPYKLPEGWEWVRLGDVSLINGGFAFKSTNYSKDGVRVVRISDFDENGFKNDKIVRHKFIEEIKSFSLEDDNILMAMTGGTVGKSLLIKAMSEPMVVNQRVATIKIVAGVVPEYVQSLIRTDIVQLVIQNAKNSTNDNISMGDITGFNLPLPPLAEQKRIVDKVDQLMALCDRLEAQLTQSQSDADTLMATVVNHLVGAAA